MTSLTRRLLIVSGVLGCALLLTQRVGSDVGGYAARIDAALPSEAGAWRCDPAAPGEADYADTGADDAWTRICRRPDGESAALYIGYARFQTDTKRLQSPRMNYPDSGDPRWSYAFKRPLALPAESGASDLRGSEMLLRHSGGRRVAVLYWFHVGPESFGGEVPYRLALLTHRAVRGRTDAAVVRLASPVGAERPEEIFARHVDLARHIYPAVAAALAER